MRRVFITEELFTCNVENPITATQMRGAIVYILQVDHSEVLTVSNMHDGLDLCSRQPRIMHAPGLPTPTPAKGSAASRAYDVSAVQRESLPIIILHSSMVWITREWRRDRTTLLSSKKTCDDTHAGRITYKKHASSCRSNIESLAVLCGPEFVKSDWL